MEIQAGLYLRKWNGSQPVVLLEHSCYYVCQGAIPSPQLDSHFLPAFTVPCYIHVYNVVAMVTWQNSKGTGRVLTTNQPSVAKDTTAACVMRT